MSLKTSSRTNILIMVSHLFCSRTFFFFFFKDIMLFDSYYFEQNKQNLKKVNLKVVISCSGFSATVNIFQQLRVCIILYQKTHKSLTCLLFYKQGPYWSKIYVNMYIIYILYVYKNISLLQHNWFPQSQYLASTSHFTTLPINPVNSSGEQYFVDFPTQQFIQWLYVCQQ